MTGQGIEKRCAEAVNIGNVVKRKVVLVLLGSSRALEELRLQRGAALALVFRSKARNFDFARRGDVHILGRDRVVSHAALMQSLESRDHGHEQRTGYIPFDTAVAALNILNEGNQILVFLDNVNGVVFFNYIMNVHQRRKLFELGHYAVVVGKFILELAENQTVLVVYADFGLTFVAAEKSHWQKFAHDQDIACLLVKAEVTRAFAVGVDSRADYVSVSQHCAIWQIGCRLLL